MLRIGIIGTGALASLMALRLAEQADVVMVGSWAEQLDAIEAGGLTLLEADGRSHTHPLLATDEPLLLPPVDVALVLVKSYQTSTAVRRLRTLVNTDTLIVTLQNGLGNWDTLAQAYGAWRVVQGVTSLGATMVRPGMVRAAGDGPISLARAAANIFFEPLVGCLRAAGFSVEIVYDVQGLVWGKLAVNAAINPLTAVLRIRNGLLAEEEPLKLVMMAAARETAVVAAAQGIQLPYPDTAQRALQVAQATAQNHSSMLQDIRRGSQTEIEAICGAVIKAGQQFGVPTPVNIQLWRWVKSAEAGQPITDWKIEVDGLVVDLTGARDQGVRIRGPVHPGPQPAAKG
ncbi:MAG: 2-dehydropantoate 2-reductase [Chloroflexi bacterium]|nr:2-dehydropantoate 2-reductase [Chloroflexota bacterium]